MNKELRVGTAIKVAGQATERLQEVLHLIGEDEFLSLLGLEDIEETLASEVDELLGDGDFCHLTGSDRAEVADTAHRLLLAQAKVLVETLRD